MRGRRFTFSLLSLALAAVSLAAQAPPPPQQPTFRADVTLVTTDVIPRDDKGRFVSDLTTENFTVLEDDKPQTISSFSMVHGGRTYNLLLPPPPPTEDGIVLPPARRRTDDAAGRMFLILVDDLHFMAEYTPQVRKLVQTIFKELVHEGDLVSVMSTGPSFIEIDPTYDHKLAVESVSKIRGSGLTPKEIFDSMESSQGPGDVRYRAQMAFYSIYNVLSQLESVNNKRKAIIYISSGYDFDPFADGRNSSDHIQGGRFSDPMRFLYEDKETNPYWSMSKVTADIDLHKLMRELTLTANRANATMYTIDPRGLAGIVGADQFLDQSEWRTFIQKTTSSLRYIAEATGGFPVVNTNDFTGELKKIDAETSDYYVIGFYSNNPDPIKRTRTLEVKVNRPNVTVQSRHAYSLKTPGKPPEPVAPQKKK